MVEGETVVKSEQVCIVQGFHRRPSVVPEFSVQGFITVVGTWLSRHLEARNPACTSRRTPRVTNYKYPYNPPEQVIYSARSQINQKV